VGIGLAYGVFTTNGSAFNSAMVTTDFGRRLNDLPILLGVVYDDLNNNNFYDAGEGVSSVEIKIEENGDPTLTASAGGYGLEVAPNNDYSVSFYHEDLGSVFRTVHVDDLNVKLDVLLSDFSKDNEGSQCSTLIQDQLTIPCVAVNNELYSAELSVADANNSLQFVLNRANKIHQSQSAQCATYQLKTDVVHLPCVAVGTDNYWADLQLIPAPGMAFKLVDYGLN